MEAVNSELCANRSHLQTPDWLKRKRNVEMKWNEMKQSFERLWVYKDGDWCEDNVWPEDELNSGGLQLPVQPKPIIR